MSRRRGLAFGPPVVLTREQEESIARENAREDAWLRECAESRQAAPNPETYLTSDEYLRRYVMGVRR